LLTAAGFKLSAEQYSDGTALFGEVDPSRVVLAAQFSANEPDTFALVDRAGLLRFNQNARGIRFIGGESWEGTPLADSDAQTRQSAALPKLLELLRHYARWWPGAAR
jgi:hypothetical protein